MVHVVEQQGLQPVLDVVVLPGMNLQLKEIETEGLLVVDHALVDVSHVHVEGLLAFEQLVAFVEDGEGHVVEAASLEGVAEVSYDGCVGGQVVQNLVEAFPGFVVLVL